MNTLKVVGIQIIPVIMVEGDDQIVAQFEGPTEQTTGWAVYTRMDDGSAVWADDKDDETTATITGLRLASEHRVPIEAQPWVK